MPTGDLGDRVKQGYEGIGPSEEPSRLVHHLPSLEIGTNKSEASVITGDWMARIGPIMRSLSPSAPTWWSQVTSGATAYYERWLHADPLRKLSIKTQAVEARVDYGLLARIEERGSILLLQALPSDLQTEAVSVRGLSSQALLFLTMSRYQPGGSSEKSMILSFLTQPYVEGQNSLSSNHAALRKWDRLYRRGRELGLQSPDPILLVKGPDVLGKIIHNKSPNAAFTVSTFRHKYQLDATPTEESVLQYCQLLTAELETLSLMGSETKQQKIAALQADTPPRTQKRQGKGGKQNSGSPNPLNEAGICRFFLSPGGCRYGRSCMYLHGTLSPSENRCFNCGAEGHSMSQCERPSSKASSKGPPSTVPKLPSKSEPKAKAEAKAPSLATSNPKAVAKNRRNPKGRKMGVSEEEQTPELDPSEEGPWEGAIRRMTVHGPHVMVSLKGLSTDAEMGLIDGGATHCLRYGPPGEYRRARPVEVHLASGSTQELRMNPVGTLLSPDPGIQPIIPMGLLASELSCEIRWTDSTCHIQHPHHGLLQVVVNRNCPEIKAAMCLELISEVEETRATAMMCSIRKTTATAVDSKEWHGMSDMDFLKALRLWVQEEFHTAPDQIQARVTPEGCSEAANSGLNRHTRRRLERGGSLVHLFSGVQRWDHPAGNPSVSLDLQRGLDLHSDELYWYLLQLARRGHISYLIGGPPCRTYTALRARAQGVEGDGGPRILRAREGKERFGLHDLSAAEQLQADGDTVLILRTLVLAEVAAEGLKVRSRDQTGPHKTGLFFAFEHPEDPKQFLDGPLSKDLPTVWSWPELRAFASRHKMFEASFHQGMLGHQKVKPTRMLLSSGYLWERLHMLKVPKGSLWKPSEASTLGQRVKDSSSWAAWAPQLVAYIRQSMLEWQKGEDHAKAEDHMRGIKLQQLLADVGVESSAHDGFSMKRLKKEDAEAFRRHCLAGHKPWRADCTACLDSMAYSRPHRRMKKSRTCALSIDITGPFRTEGAEDQEVSKPKYLLVGAYTFPVFGKTGLELPEDPKIPSPEEFEDLASDPAAEKESWEVPEDVPVARALTPSERKRLEDENKRWEAIVTACKDTDYKLVEIPMAEVLPCKSTHAVIGALNRFYAKLRFWGLPVYRLHSDCAGEFTHGSLRQWANHRSIHVTTTMPESKASNGRAERLVGRLKQRIRVLISGHKLGHQYWPHAARYAVEDMQRAALRALGHDANPLAPFYSLVRFRSRSWRDSAWGSRSTEGRLVAPCTDVSKGYIIRVLDRDVVRFYATTLIYRDFKEPVGEPEIDAADDVAAEVHGTRFEPGWPPPPGSGDIQHESLFDEPKDGRTAVASATKDTAPASVDTHGRYLPPSHRTRTKSPGTLRKVALESSLDACWEESTTQSCMSQVADMSVDELKTQARLLARASITGLNRDRVVAVLMRALGLAGGRVELELALSHGGLQTASPVSLLLAAILQQVQVPQSACRCVLLEATPCEVLARIQDEGAAPCYLLPLMEGPVSQRIWLPLVKGSLVQGELVPQPDEEPTQALLGQLCDLVGWHALLLVDVAKARCVGSALPRPLLWVIACLSSSLVAAPAQVVSCGLTAPASMRACGQQPHGASARGMSPALTRPVSTHVHACRPASAQEMSPTVACPASTHVPEHKPSLWGESPYVSQDNYHQDSYHHHEHRWFKNLPLPEVEPVSKELLYDDEENDKTSELDGMRLATMAAIRDQETALARELQAGHKILAKSTAENLTDLNRMVEGLEEVLCAVVDNVSELYEGQGPQSRDVMLRALAPEEGKELLQAKVIPINEVCEHIEQWREAIGEEVASVINKHRAGTFRSEAEVRTLESEGKYQVIRVPGKLVAAIKPPRRFKARLVACGNFLHSEKTRKSSTLDRTDLYCSNLDIFSLRIQLAIGIQKGWRVASVDVKTAFLTAPFQAGRTTGPEPKQKVILVKVPKAVVIAGFAEPGSYIQVDKALYGLQESPHSWSLDRDLKLKKLCWKNANGEERRLVTCEADACIWKILTPCQKMVGTLGVYVDDLLFLAERTELEAAVNAIRSVWECSATEYADSQDGMGFCGIQILQRDKELWIHQGKYIEELGKRYDHLKPSPFLPDFKSLPESETPSASDVRSAQKIIGELTWIAGRTRPDVSYTVNRMSRMTTTMPKHAYACGEQVIRFLMQTKMLMIKYSPSMAWPEDLTEALPQTRDTTMLESFCDASFAQQDSRSQSGVFVTLAGQAVAWLSLQQPFIALSTAEAEMIACTEGVALTQALQPLISELLERETCWLLYNDSIACSSILSYPSGSWRTRHLRLRSKALQEMISDELLSIHHVPGKFMTADLLTKPLSPPRIMELWKYAGLDASQVEGPSKARTKANVEMVPIVKVIMVSLLVAPVQAQGPEETWTYQAFGVKAIMCLFSFLVMLMLVLFRKRRALHRRLDGQPIIIEVQTMQEGSGLPVQSATASPECPEEPVVSKDPVVSKESLRTLRQPHPLSALRTQ